MPCRRLIPLIVSLSVVAAACSAGDREVQLREPGAEGGGLAMELVQQEGAPSDVDQIIDQTSALIEAVEMASTAVAEGTAAECAAATTALERPGADLSTRTFIAPQDLRCAELTGASFEGARLEGVDLSGASLAGANLRGARLQIVAVGADLTGADLTGADLRGSDLTGAILNSAILVGSDLSELTTTSVELDGLTAGGLTGATLDGAILGCNRLDGSPLVAMRNVTVDIQCASEFNGFTHVRLGGSFLGADLTGLDMGNVFLSAVDFRGTMLQDVTLSDYGVLPRGLDFSIANLRGADLSGNTLDRVAFFGADLSDVNLSNVVVADSAFVRADLSGANFSGSRSEHNDYRWTTVNGTDFTNASLSWDNFAGAEFTDPLTAGVTIEAVVCDGGPDEDVDNGNSVRNFGLCTVGNELIF